MGRPRGEARNRMGVRGIVGKRRALPSRRIPILLSLQEDSCRACSTGIARRCAIIYSDMAHIVVPFEPGGYRYIRGVFQYSAGVAAQPGFELERARFARPLSLVQGFAAVEAHLKSLGRPSTAFAACEL